MDEQFLSSSNAGICPLSTSYSSFILRQLLNLGLEVLRKLRGDVAHEDQGALHHIAGVLKLKLANRICCLPSEIIGKQFQHITLVAGVQVLGFVCIKVQNPPQELC